MTVDELAADLDSSALVDHDAFAAAARVRWPVALKAVREAQELLEQILNTGKVQVEVVGAGAELAALRERFDGLMQTLGQFLSKRPCHADRCGYARTVRCSCGLSLLGELFKLLNAGRAA